MINLFFNLSLPFVSIGLLSFILYSFRRRRNVFVVATLSSAIAFLCLSFVILLLLSKFGLKITHVGASRYLIFAWVIMVIYFVAEFQCRIRLLGSILMPIALMLMLIAMFEEKDAFTLSTSLVSVATVIHMIFVFLGLGLMFLSFAAAILFLLKTRALKYHRASSVDGRLPALPVLKQLMETAFYSGFPALTIGIILGIIYAGSVLPQGWIGDAKIIAGLTTWFIYSVLFFLRQSDHLNYEHLAKGIIFLFIVTIASFLFTSHKPLMVPGVQKTISEPTLRLPV